MRRLNVPNAFKCPHKLAMPNFQFLAFPFQMAIPKGFSLLLLCLAGLLLSGLAEQPMNKQIRARREPKSRQKVADLEECVLGYKERIRHHCRYPGTEQACFQSSPEKPTGGEEAALEEAAKKCCRGGLCSTQHFEGLCCRTMECLEKCYGQAFFQRFRDRGFKYLDILLRPHPRHRTQRDLVRELEDLEETLEQIGTDEEAGGSSTLSTN